MIKQLFENDQIKSTSLTKVALFLNACVKWSFPTRFVYRFRFWQVNTSGQKFHFARCVQFLFKDLHALCQYLPTAAPAMTTSQNQFPSCQRSLVIAFHATAKSIPAKMVF